jgi:hypothetical protein
VRPPPRQAGPDLLVLVRFEEFTGWLLDHTAKGTHRALRRAQIFVWRFGWFLKMSRRRF